MHFETVWCVHYIKHSCALYFMKTSLFCTPELARPLAKHGLVIDASSRQLPYCMLSPFFVWNKVIPVPGFSDRYSRSVEAIWQGLKIIDGKTDFSLFEIEYIRKRRTEPYGTCQFQYGEEKIDYRIARHRIFVPAFEWMYHHLLPDAMKESFYVSAEKNVQLYFFDVGSNPDIDNLSTSYSHASLLVDIINKELERRSRP